MTAPIILIVGAGLCGLMAAIELTRRGFKPRIIDKKKCPSSLSRAVGINDHSLRLLQPSGVSKSLIELGIKITGANFHENDKHMSTFDFTKAHTTHNYLLALAQNETESIMIDALARLGVEIQWNTCLEGLTNHSQNVKLQHNDSRSEQTFQLVIGADGIGSEVRQSCNIDFVGFDYPDKWSIADFTLNNALFASNHAQIFLYDAGRILLVITIEEHRYRAVSNTDDALSLAPSHWNIGTINRAASFTISVRQLPSYNLGLFIWWVMQRMHIHRPVGEE